MGFPNIMIEGFAGRSLGETPTVSGLTAKRHRNLEVKQNHPMDLGHIF
jgi:hypothetical protein